MNAFRKAIKIFSNIFLYIAVLCAIIAVSSSVGETTQRILIGVLLTYMVLTPAAMILNSFWLEGKELDESLWADPEFNERVFVVLDKEIDWDSFDDHRFNQWTCQAETFEGTTVLVAAVNRSEKMIDVFEDARELKRELDFPENTPFWLYVPVGFSLPEDMSEHMVIKRVPEKN